VGNKPYSATYSAAVIGLGAIGAQYGAANNALVMNHCTAYEQHQGFNLCGVIDSCATLQLPVTGYRLAR